MKNPFKKTCSSCDLHQRLANKFCNHCGKPMQTETRVIAFATAALVSALAIGGAAYAFYPANNAAPQSFAATTTEQKNFHIRGNRNSKIYHWQGCPNYDDIAANHIVEFATTQEAEAAGYRAARNCRVAKPQ